MSDIETDKATDPMRKAQEQMRTPLPRRFYKDVSIEPAGEAFEVRLDGRPVRTPGRAPLALPTMQAAQLVADEFAAQADVIDPTSMPATRLANTAIDGVSADPQAVLEDILRYAGTDLLCYRAEGPEGLVAKQAELWDPVLDWARTELHLRFFLAEGVMHVAQPRETLAVLGAHLARDLDPLRLAALHVMTTLTGSALLAVAVDAGELDAAAAWQAAHVDEDWNIALWGEDAEAVARRAMRWNDMKAAAALRLALRDAA